MWEPVIQFLRLRQHLVSSLCLVFAVVMGVLVVTTHQCPNLLSPTASDVDLPFQGYLSSVYPL